VAKGITDEILDIVWPETGGQDIRKGVLAYALFADPTRQSPPLPADVWPPGTRFDSSTLTDENWVVIMWTILPSEWPQPDRWCPTLERTLSALSDGEAAVAWCALEGSFEVPPALFDPDGGRDEVYAAYVPGRFACSARLGASYESVSRAEMIEFKEHTRQRFGTDRRQ
jgi:hypothetical protein